jgi:hypothetical protein
MEINFENKTVSAFREIYHQTKRSQESTESVVPDTDDDIGKIASVQTAVMLKSKDVTARGVLISGEACASIVYITESQEKVAFVQLTKAFSIEYEIPDISSDAVAQISLNIVSCESRVVNPRKVSVTFEISGELSCYMRENITAECNLPDEYKEMLHAKYDSTELILIDAACEKTFSINEQFAFPSGKPSPSRIISQQVDYVVTDSQLIGSKIIFKGNVNVGLSYLSDEVNYPVKTEFTTPFSQIVDIGCESLEHCSINIELTSAYFEIINTISNEKALDTELHAVMQLVSYSKQNLCYVSDTYSNKMPAECIVETKQFNLVSGIQKLKLISDERINVADDCSDVLSAFVDISDISQEQSKLRVTVGINIIYRDSNGLLSAVRRMVNMEGEATTSSLRINGSRLCDIYLRPDGQFIDGHLSVELSYLVCSSVEIKQVTAVKLDEEACFELSRYPSVTLVKVEKESLWELAKTYHSSIEEIKAYNDLEDGVEGKLLLIPKAV